MKTKIGLIVICTIIITICIVATAHAHDFESVSFTIDEPLDGDRLQAFFDNRTKGFTYKSPLSDMIKEPVGLPDAMRTHGTIGELKEAIIKQAEDDAFSPARQ